jgi:hypothetical protein
MGRLSKRDQDGARRAKKSEKSFDMGINWQEIAAIKKWLQVCGNVADVQPF